MPKNYEDGGADWIGVYRTDFMGLEEYYGYEYTETHGDKPKHEARLVKINFSDSINLPLDGQFVLLYFRCTGIRGSTSLLGTSEPFSVIKRCPSPNINTID